MDPMDNEKFGAFVAQMRKQKGWTQKDLAQKLCLSDKAVSKWERGLSMPDVALLSPLADLLGVTVTELLRGQKAASPDPLDAREVDELVSKTLRLSADEEQRRVRGRRHRALLYFSGAAAAVLECALLLALGYSPASLRDNIGLAELFNLLFGSWFCLFARETLPAYYDENKISFYSSGVFRMNLAGIRFHNSNWPHILRAGYVWTLAIAVLFPLLYLVLSRYFPALWGSGKGFQMASALGLFIPLYIAGKRYE